MIRAFQPHRPTRFDPLDDLGERGAVVWKIAGGRQRGQRGRAKNRGQANADLDFREAARSREQRRRIGSQAAHREEIQAAQEQQAAQQRDFGAKHDAIGRSIERRGLADIVDRHIGAGADQQGDRAKRDRGKTRGDQTPLVPAQLRQGYDKIGYSSDPSADAEHMGELRDIERRRAIGTAGGMGRPDLDGEQDSA